VIRNTGFGRLLKSGGKLPRVADHCGIRRQAAANPTQRCRPTKGSAVPIEEEFFDECDGPHTDTLRPVISHPPSSGVIISGVSP